MMTETAYGVVPRQFAGETIVILASGPSLIQADVDVCRGRARVLAVKHTIDLAPWADVLYGAGSDRSRWWHRTGDSLGWYQGLRFTLDPTASAWATVLKNTGYTGLETDPTGLRTGKNSGYQAINLAVLLGAAKIILLGFDMQKDAEKGHHYFGEHPHGVVPPFRDFLPLFDSLVEPLQALGVQVINASRVSALKTFPMLSLVEALS